MRFFSLRRGPKAVVSVRWLLAEVLPTALLYGSVLAPVCSRGDAYENKKTQNHKSTMTTPFPLTLQLTMHLRRACKNYTERFAVEGKLYVRSRQTHACLSNACCDCGTLEHLV